jgi:hypothetical protein
MGDSVRQDRRRGARNVCATGEGEQRAARGTHGLA